MDTNYPTRMRTKAKTKTMRILYSLFSFHAYFFVIAPHSTREDTQGYAESPSYDESAKCTSMLVFVPPFLLYLFKIEFLGVYGWSVLVFAAQDLIFVIYFFMILVFYFHFIIQCCYFMDPLLFVINPQKTKDKYEKSYQKSIPKKNHGYLIFLKEKRFLFTILFKTSFS